MAARSGSLVTKHELLDAVWGEVHVTDGALKRCVVEIRKALDDSGGAQRYVQTLHGRGYRFMPGSGATVKTTDPSPGRPVLFVGRQREFDQLDAGFREASQGVRQVVFITGEAGLGKTALVDNWLLGLTSRDNGPGQPLVCRGRCLQQFGSGEPYLPVFEALEQLSRALGGRLSGILRTHAPTWLLHMPSLVSLQDCVKLRDEVFGTSRERMLREITDALERLSADIPVVLVIEDLHWSDPSTIDLLTSMANRSSPAQLMVLATYRPAELGGISHPLNRVRHEMEIHGRCRVLPLSYLTESEIRDYLAHRLSAPDADAKLVQSLHRRTSGNPLFLTCVVDELLRSGGVDANQARIRNIIPDTLQNMFELQAGQLTQAEREIVEAAAAEGEIFRTASIARALGRDQAEVEDCCEALTKRQVLLKPAEPVRLPGGAESARYSFLHVLCREALYRRLRPGRRSRLHSSLGNAIEDLYSSELERVAAELAAHFELAGEYAKAIRLLRLAAEGSAGRFANREAARHLERALDLLGNAGDGGSSSLRMDLLEQRALMRLSTMDLEGSAADFAQVDAHALRTGNVNRRVKALLDSVMPWGFLDCRRALGAIEEARRFKSEADPVLAALVDAYHGGAWTYFFGWNQELEDLVNAARPAMEPVADAATRCRFLWMESFVRNGASDYVTGCRVAQESRECARRAGSFHQYFVATHNLITGSIHRGRLGEALRIAREGSEMAATNHHLLERFMLESQQAFAAIEAFDFDTAQRICERIVREPIMMGYDLTQNALLWLGLARLGAGDIDGASEALDRLTTIVEAGGVGFEYRFPLLQGQASCALRRGDYARAKCLVSRSIELAQEHRARGYAARGYRMLSEIASEEGDNRGACEHVSAALAALNGCDIPNEEWQVYAARARVLAVRGRRQESEQARTRALQVAERVAATLADEPALRRSLLSRIELQAALRRTA